MLDMIGRVICHKCNSRMRIVSICPSLPGQKIVTFQCTNGVCQLKRELVVTALEDKPRANPRVA